MESTSSAPAPAPAPAHAPAVPAQAPAIGEREAEMIAFAKNTYHIDLVPPFTIDNCKFVDTICVHFIHMMNDDEKYKHFVDTTNSILCHAYFNTNQDKQQIYMQCFIDALQCFSQNIQSQHKKEMLVRSLITFICHANNAVKYSTKLRIIANDITKFPASAGGGGRYMNMRDSQSTHDEALRALQSTVLGSGIDSRYLQDTSR